MSAICSYDHFPQNEATLGAVADDSNAVKRLQPTAHSELSTVLRLTDGKMFIKPR